jgi:hypothetical protein
MRDIFIILSRKIFGEKSFAGVGGLEQFEQWVRNKGSFAEM